MTTWAKILLLSAFLSGCGYEPNTKGLSKEDKQKVEKYIIVDNIPIDRPYSHSCKFDVLYYKGYGLTLMRDVDGNVIKCHIEKMTENQFKLKYTDVYKW